MGVAGSQEQSQQQRMANAQNHYQSQFQASGQQLQQPQQQVQPQQQQQHQQQPQQQAPQPQVSQPNSAYYQNQQQQQQQQQQRASMPQVQPPGQAQDQFQQQMDAFRQAPQGTMTQQDYNNLYRTWRQSIGPRGPQQQQVKKESNLPQPGEGDSELKNFYIKVYMQKDSIKTRVTEDHKLQISFKCDALSNTYIRINTCVTEKKNGNNVPEMFYTPNRQDYVQEVRLKTGLDQTIDYEQINFDLNYLAAFEMKKSVKDYHPLIISMNYNDGAKPYAMMSYGVFTKDGDQNINGARITKQVALIDGVPFELKSIYGMEKDHDVVEGDEQVEVNDEDHQQAECLICLCENKDTLIMPCGHYCICSDCGKALIDAKQTCPICRGNIGSLIPMKKH